MTDAELVGWIVDVFEGGLSKNPADRGGVTKYGVTRLCWLDYYGVEPQPGEIAALTRAQAIGMLVEIYVQRAGFTAARVPDDGLRLALVDYAINSGAAQAVRDLQRCVGATVINGRFGAVTLAALQARKAEQVRAQLTGRRLVLLGEALFARSDQIVFLAGWLDRVRRVAAWKAPALEARQV